MNQTLLKTEQGVTVVETAIALPCFILFLFSIVQVTILTTSYVAATEAASAAARETAAISGGMVIPYACSTHVRDKLQQDLDRLMIPARVTSASFPAMTNANGLDGFELQATIQVACPLCIGGFGLSSALSRISVRHFVPSLNTASCS